MTPVPKYKTSTVTDYKLVETEDVFGLLKEGWELYGHPVCNSNDRIWQAMVKYEIITIEDP